MASSSSDSMTSSSVPSPSESDSGKPCAHVRPFFKGQKRGGRKGQNPFFKQCPCKSLLNYQ